ncbi:MAG: hypothetical protein M3O35_17490, partial [Acidobacteriota bacterium]|nr:hypothetical protein [Acidobacteriota bacterium]
LGIGYRAAWYLARRIRLGKKLEPFIVFRDAVRDLLQAKPERKALKGRKPKDWRPQVRSKTGN